MAPLIDRFVTGHAMKPVAGGGCYRAFRIGRGEFSEAVKTVLNCRVFKAGFILGYILRIFISGLAGVLIWQLGALVPVRNYL